jgi:hypothetical protein
VEAVKASTGINVLDIEDPQSELLKQLIEFPPMCCGIVEALVEEQLTACGVTKKEFRRAMNGDAIGDALEGLRAELVNFSPRSRRALLRTVQEKQRAVEASGIKLALESLSDPKLLEAAEAQLRQSLKREMEKILESDRSPLVPSETGYSTPVMKPPASWASTPDVLPGASSA